MNRGGAGPSPSSMSRSVLTGKRDARAADLETPKPSAAKRQALTSSSNMAAMDRKVASLETQNMELQRELRKKETENTRLEQERRWLSEQEEAERTAKEEAQAVLDQTKRSLNAELRSVRASLTSLEQDHADLKDAHSALSRTSDQSAAAHRNEITQLRRQLEIVNEDFSDMKALADDRQQEIEVLRSDLEDLSSQQARPQQDVENMGIIRDELHRQSTHLRQLESANTKLKAELARNGNVDVLREEKRTLERRVRGMDELRQRVAELEGQLDASTREREDWANKSIEHTPGHIPISVTQQLTDLRLAHAQALEATGAAKALLRSKDAEIVDIRAQEKEALKRIGELEKTVESLQARKRQVEALEDEVTFRQALVASFENENAQPADERVVQLEAIIASYKELNEKLTTELEGLVNTVPKDDLQREREQLTIAQADLERVQAECDSHLQRIETLEQELFELGGEIGGGRHVPPGARVLTMNDNPYQEWVDIREEVVQRLRSENEALLSRLADVESRAAPADIQAAPGAGMVPRESWEIVNQEKLELENTLKQKDKRLLRLQQVFQSKSAEFRQAIAEIFGVKLAFQSNGQVRVTSVFDLSAVFVFSPNAGGMQLVALGEDGPKDLESVMGFWIQEEQCIPGYMATATLECYETYKHRRQAEGDE